MKQLSFLLSIAVLLTACASQKQGAPDCFDGRVRWAGDPAADGMGWVIQKGTEGSQQYVPQTLADDYKVDNLEVTVCLQETNEKVVCFCANPPNKFRVASIKRR